jgi:hypothetical protein
VNVCTCTCIHKVHHVYVQSTCGTCSSFITGVLDFTGLMSTVNLTPTVTQQCVSVMIEDDSVLEETESLTVSLSLTGAPDGVQLSEQTATIVITNDDVYSSLNRLPLLSSLMMMDCR